MICIHQQFGHSSENDRLSLHKGTYEPPRVSSETELALETDLLAGSIWQTMSIEIAGQGMQDLYFEEGDLDMDYSYWGD